DIDFIICTTVQGDTVTPSLGCVLQKEIGANCAAVDMNGACAGFIYALDFADSMLKAGKAKRVLVISAEGMSRLCDWTDRSTCVLFGDGAGAVVVDAEDNLFCARLTSDGNAVPLNILPDTGNSPFLKEHHPLRRLYMDGQEIYKFAVSHSTADLQAVIASAGISQDEVNHYLLHQANKRIVDAVRARLKQPAEKFPVNVNIRGNTSSASIPILLDEENRSGRFKNGDLLVMSAFGAGLTTGACIIRWTRD
ncbi:MAG: beta-ketoacyl-ACP synthase 3, partial [Clostridia bacterium]|nr:beta-ketoacyl-ACP synthase 3 [Clostridia bacterium]